MVECVLAMIAWLYLLAEDSGLAIVCDTLSRVGANAMNSQFRSRLGAFVVLLLPRGLCFQEVLGKHLQIKTANLEHKPLSAANLEPRFDSPLQCTIAKQAQALYQAADGERATMCLASAAEYIMMMVHIQYDTTLSVLDSQPAGLVEYLFLR